MKDDFMRKRNKTFFISVHNCTLVMWKLNKECFLRHDCRFYAKGKKKFLRQRFNFRGKRPKYPPWGIQGQSGGVWVTEGFAIEASTNGCHVKQSFRKCYIKAHPKFYWAFNSAMESEKEDELLLGFRIYCWPFANVAVRTFCFISTSAYSANPQCINWMKLFIPLGFE